MHLMIDLIKENESFLRIQDIVNEYGLSQFSDNISAIGE